MKAYIFQHVPFESPAAIKEWLVKNHFEINTVAFYSEYQLPSVEEVDWLVVMGGPMSVNDETELPWLKEEKTFIKKCIEAGKIVVGVCLGSQLIVSALGSRVYQGKQKEIGWFPVKFINTTIIKDTNPMIFHWHGETFDLPAGAKLIASTDVCAHQIFTIGSNVLAMQCHLEMTGQAVTGMLKNCASELVEAPFIQSATEIEAGTKQYASAANGLLFKLLDSLK
jgi:GMP synthase-like glutamine amidotransferase